MSRDNDDHDRALCDCGECDNERRARTSHGARYTASLLESATQGDRAAALFRISSEVSGFCVFVVVLEHPVLGGAGHPLAQLLSGRDALERGMALFDRCVSAVTSERS